MDTNKALITQKQHIRKGWKKTVMYATLAVLSFFLVSIVVLPLITTALFLNQRFERTQHESLDYGIESKRITLKTSDGLSLAAWRTLADDSQDVWQGAPRGTVIILSGIQNPSVTAFFGHAQMLAEQGWDTLLIEKRARSLSEGQSIGLGFTEWKDVQAGVNFLDADARAGDLPIIAKGTSAGAATVLIAGAEVPRIDGIISISAYTSFTDAYVDVVSSIGVPRFVADASRPVMHLNLGLRFGFDEIEKTPLNAIGNLGERPVLLMQSTEDWQVTFAHFERLQQKAEDSEVYLSTFVREGDWHFVIYDQFFESPTLDQEFSQALFEFLEQF
jgi:fermentation-respiration switch protein FrsA (DUF1100 family)